MQAPLSIPLANYPANVDKEANLYIHTDIAQLVNQAVSMVTVDQDDPHYFHHLYANLIFNYLGKWCRGEDGNPAPINVALLEEGVFSWFAEQHFCPIYPDEVLSRKFTHILQQERAFVRTLDFAEQNIAHNLNQIKDPAMQRIVRDLPVGSNRWRKWHPRTGFWYTRTPKAIERNAPKPGTLHTKKQPGSLLPTDVKCMRLFINQGVGILFDFAEVYHKHEKYCFEQNAATNDQWWYRGSSIGNPRSVSIDTIRANNQRVVDDNSQIDWNEIRVGLPKRCVRGTVALADNPNNRFLALLSMYCAKDEFELDYELPVFVRDQAQPNSLRYYSHFERLKDFLIFDSNGIDDTLYNNNFVKQIVMTSFERLSGAEKQSILDELTECCENQNLELTEFLNGHLEEKASIALTIQPCAIKLGEYGRSYHVTGEAVLSGLALMAIFPLAGVGFYQMIRDALELEEAQWMRVARGVGITLATLTVLPLVIYGGRHAVATLVNSVSYEDPNEQRIEVDNNVPIQNVACRVV